MSTENVALFVRELNKRNALRQLAIQETQTADWVRLASDSGFEFSAQEFAQVVSDALGRRIGPETAAQDYLMAQSLMGDEELSFRTLEAVIGIEVAAYVVCNPLFVRGTVPKKPIMLPLVIKHIPTPTKIRKTPKKKR